MKGYPDIISGSLETVKKVWPKIGFTAMTARKLIGVKIGPTPGLDMF